MREIICRTGYVTNSDTCEYCHIFFEKEYVAVFFLTETSDGYKYFYGCCSTDKLWRLTKEEIEDKVFDLMNKSSTFDDNYADEVGAVEEGFQSYAVQKIVQSFELNFYDLEEDYYEFTQKSSPYTDFPLYEDVNSMLTAFKEEIGEWKYYNDLLYIIFKSYLGQLETIDDFLRIFSLPEDSIRTEIIQKNGGMEKFISILNAKLLDSSDTHELYSYYDKTISEKNNTCFLLEKLPHDNFIVTPIQLSKESSTIKMTFKSIYKLWDNLKENKNEEYNNFDLVVAEIDDKKE